MNKFWIVGIGIVAIAIVAFFILNGGSKEKTTTTTSSTESSATGGLLGALGGIWGNVFSPIDLSEEN